MNSKNNDLQIKTKELNLHVRQDFEIPVIYTNGSVEEIEEALFIGDTIQQSIKSRRLSDDVRKITELKDGEIQRIRSSYQETLDKLMYDIQVVSSEKEKIASEYMQRLNAAKGVERESCVKEWEEKGNNVLTSQYHKLEASRRVLEESRDKDIRDAVTRTEELMQKIMTSKEEQLAKMESNYQRLHESIIKQSEEFSKLSGILGKRSAIVKTKGSDYGEQFGEKLKRHYGICQGFKLIKGKSHAIDFLLEMEGQVVMWEVKDYTTMVPKKDVEKFLNDLKGNPQAKIGVMISRTSDISGKNDLGSMSTEFYNDKMMIYFNKFEEFCGDDENRVFQMLASLLRVWWEYRRGEKNTFDSAEIVRELEKAIADISKRLTDWRHYKAKMDEMMRWMDDQFKESEKELNRVLKKARNT